MALKYCIVTLTLISGLALVSSKIPEQVDDSMETNAEMLQSDLANNPGLQDWLFERRIRKSLEGFKTLMKDGDKPMKIPVLDPMYSAKEVLYFNGFNGMLDLALQMWNSSTTGLSDFNINKISASLFHLTADIDLTFNAINSQGVYDVQGALFNELQVLNAQGKLNYGLENLNLLLHVKLGFNFKKWLYVKRVSVEYDLQGTAYMDGLTSTYGLNKLLAGGVANLLNKNREKIQPYVEAAAKKSLSQLIDGMTLSELVSYLQGLNNA